MTNRAIALCSLPLMLLGSLNARGAEAVSSSSSLSFSLDTVTVTDSTFTIDGSDLPFRLDYSSSLWNDEHGDGSVRIKANDETVLETTGEGSFLWSPQRAGYYTLTMTSANAVTISKIVNVVAPTVTIEREGLNLCKLTASDGVSDIRYTTDGSIPTAESALYTGPFEVPPCRFSIVRAMTFAVGCPQGEVVSAGFKPVASFVSVASSKCAIDNSGEIPGTAYSSVPLPYDASWIGGDSGATVVIEDNGVEIGRVNGAGEEAFALVGKDGLHNLTYKTLIDEIVQEETYTATVFKGWAYEVDDNDDAILADTAYKSGDVVIPAEIDGHTVVGIAGGGPECELQVGDWISVDSAGTGMSNAYRSNGIGDGGRTEMALAIEGPLDWSFKWKVSSEGGYDYLRWSIDGNEQNAISGTGGNWEDVICQIPEGEHSVSWVYTKDGSASNGDDCAWVAFDIPQGSPTMFSGCDDITSVTIPGNLLSSISELFPDAYDKITSITLTGSITEMPARAFQGCSSLTGFTIPETVTSIGERAFEGCSGLTGITIPDSVWNIGEGAFDGCSSLRRVEAAIGLKRLLDSDGMFADCPEDLEVVYHQTAEISDVTAKQRYPWNGKVDITYTLTGDVTAGFAPDNHPVLQIIATDNTMGESYVADTSTLSGDTGTAEGIHHVIWDLNAQGLALLSDDVTFTVEYAPVMRYCVIDLSGGANASSYPVTYLASVPSGGWSDEYKTTKLVLRKIEPGEIPTRSARITRPFYIGVFEVTQAQWELVISSNSNPSATDKRAQNYVSYNDIRGSGLGGGWPESSEVDATSFLGKLREKTGIDFDLPTEAQWEYACRAGTTSKYNNGGDTESDLATLGRYLGNQNDGRGGYSGVTVVGSYAPNAWGLYDMHGNVWEWCLDWYNYSGALTGDEPVGASSGSYRVIRGGSCYAGDGADHCTSSSRIDYDPSCNNHDIGFRLVRPLSNIEGERSPEAVAGAERADTLCAAEAAPVAIDSRVDVEPVLGEVAVAWDAAWIGGNSGATVVIEDNGVEIARKTGAGEFEYQLTGPCKHTLTYKTLIDDDEQEETYTATVFKGWAYEVDDNGDAILVDTAYKAGDVVIPAVIDGHAVVGIAEHAFEGCEALTSVTIPDSVASIGEEAFAGCTGLRRVEAPKALRGMIESRNVFKDCADDLEIVYFGPEISEVVAKQRYPWNGLVDISFTVTGMENSSRNYGLVVMATIPDIGEIREASHCHLVRDSELSDSLAVNANGNYRLLWDAEADLGKVYYENLIVRVDIAEYAQDIYEKVQLWENGPYWATTNIGAEEPEDYGYYFWWGDTVGYKRENNKWVASDGSSSNFSFASGNTPTYCKYDDTLQGEGWIAADGVLAPEHDAAHIHWGGNWRIPTDAEFSALINNCTTTWTTRNGVYGRLVTGKGAYADRSIFLPAAGYGYDSSLYYPGSLGRFWSSSPTSDSSDYAWDLSFSSSYFFRSGYDDRLLGQSVRPVQGFTGQGNPTYTEDDSSGDSAPFVFDTVTSSAPGLRDAVSISYDAAWIGGNSGATVVIEDNGVEIARKTGAGEFEYQLAGEGRHNLTYKTLINGVEQEEQYAATILDSIEFGDMYAYASLTWTEDDKEVCFEKSAILNIYTGAYLQGSVSFDGYAVFEVIGAKSKDEIRPVVENLGFKGSATATVLSDDELRQMVMPPLSTAGEWDIDFRSIDSRGVGDISGAYVYGGSLQNYDYEDSAEYEWPKDLWPDNTAVGGRFWVAVKLEPSKYMRWYGIDGSVRVWQSGTNVKSDKFYTAYSTEAAWPFHNDASGLFRGITIDTKFFCFDSYVWDSDRAAYDAPLCQFWLVSAPADGSPLSITLPEAGVLYMSAEWTGDLDDIQVQNADSVSQVTRFNNLDKYSSLGDEAFYFESGCSDRYSGYLAITVNSARTITLEREDEDDDYDFTRLQFFPSSSKAVAVEASYYTILGMGPYNRYDGHNNEYLQGYVTGTGVYKVGETVALTAVPAPGEAFDHWELKYGNFPEGIDTTNPTLNFTVTDELAGTAEERKQMVVRAVWKEKREIVATPNDIVMGAVSGSGMYIDGSEVKLTATANKGYMFSGWSDGVTTASRTIEVDGEDRELCAYFEVSQECPVEDVLDGDWSYGANGEASVEGRIDATAEGGVSVRLSAEDDASAWVETVVTNGCRVSFDWKCSCEELVKGSPYDYMYFAVDGEQQDFICGETDWTNETFLVAGDGEHTLSWVFARDDEGSSGQDCAWLANVDVVPAVEVAFEAGGATEGIVPSMEQVYSGDSIILPDQGTLIWPKHTFAGWSNGAAAYDAGEEYVATGDTVFTALWVEKTLSAPVIHAPEEYEADFATVTITAEEGASIRYTLDGSVPTSESLAYQGPFNVEGSATIRAIAVRDDYYDSEAVSFAVTRLPWTFGEYLNCNGRLFTTGGDAEWVRAKGVSEDGYALKSGDIGNSQTSRLETVVTGPGTIRFSCRVEGEILKKQVWDGLAFCIDGVQQCDLMGNEDWEVKSYEVAGAGSHTVGWLYVKDEEGNGQGEDCAWLDKVVWTPKNDDVAYVTVPDEKAEVVASGGRYVVTAKGDEVLTEGDFTFAVVPKEAYKIEIAPDGKSATVTLAAPEIAVATEQEADDGDPSGLLADVDEGDISAKPEPEAGETLGALPVKTYPGLYYQASWGDDLGDMTTGEKVQATGEKLYLGVIKQTGDKGFYKISVSEE